MSAERSGDLERTMETMSPSPYLINVPNGLGGDGYDCVKSFYTTKLVGKFFPPDALMTRISITVGHAQIVDELVISFTHTQAIEWMLPNISPTGKKLEVPFVVIAGVSNMKVTHEHVYWDQACALVQLGLLDPTGLPVVGAESAKYLLNKVNNQS